MAGRISWLGRTGIAIGLVVALSAGGAALLPVAPAAAATGTTRNDLGTLGGGFSSATAVSGNIVVGSAELANGETHAFAYDVGAAKPKMRDLGKLSGTDSSTAVAVSGNVVAGNSDTRAGAHRAFSYDLGAATPTMRDLGSLGGTGDDSATGVSGNIVVGSASTAGGKTHAFVYDLGAATPTMRDLGTLGNAGDSSAHAVSGNIVVGQSQVMTATTGLSFHAFAYDLAAATPTMRDLGTLGGQASGATAVSGNIVVGAANAATGYPHAFVYDLEAARPAMRDLGTFGGDESIAQAVSGNLVVGWAHLASGHNHAFAYDVGAGAPKRDLGTLGGTDSNAQAVSGSIVVGTATTPDRDTHAFVYDFAATTPTMFDFDTTGTVLNPALAVSGSIVVGAAGNSGSEHALAWHLGTVLAPPPPPPLTGTKTERYVQQAYLDLLGRATDPAGEAYWSQLIDSGTPRTTVAFAIVSSFEFQFYMVEGMYQFTLHRDVDFDSVDYWTGLLDQGYSIERLSAVIMGSDEYYARAGGTTNGFINAAFHDALNRLPDPGGRAYFVSLLQQGVPRGGAAGVLTLSAEGIGLNVDSYYWALLGRHADRGGLTYWVGAIGAGHTDQEVIALLVGSGEYFAHI
jgi:probable HAF family extracellular repeat protein